MGVQANCCSLQMVQLPPAQRITRWRGSTGTAVVLAYHAIADRPGDPILRRYSVPAARFARQLDTLASAGWTFVDASALIGALAGSEGLPPRAVLVTFDDGYADFPAMALPVLKQRQIPCVVFVVSSLV
ncbi:MAG: polysaccharide deacetylase family protein, partial [Solirubrobacteraceae bacterium]